MDPIGRSLNSEELSVLSVLGQEGRGASARTSLTIATSLERDVVDVAGVLERLKRDGLVATVEDEGVTEEVWVAVGADG
jgi:Mn-dependent DtxR family transcriptional regulator